MSGVTLTMKMSPKQTAKMYMRNLELEKQVKDLQEQAKNVEKATRDIALELEDHGYGDSKNLSAYKNLMQCIINQ